MKIWTLNFPSMVIVSSLLLSAFAGAAWAEDQQVVAHGKAVFEKWCAACHGAGDGGNDFLTDRLIPRLPGTNALHAKYNDKVPALLEERTDLTPDSIEYFVRNGITLMAPFRKTEVSDDDLRALSAYLTRNNEK
jgi:mono/diheme cytochrome c family protein